MGKDSSKELLLIALGKFYSRREYIDNIQPILQGTSCISLRLLDWFVTNYCKKHNVIIGTTNIYLSYRAQLKAYSKQQFDPFRRRERINFYYDSSQFIETTIGQLNFFRWVLSNHVLDYVGGHIADIEADMLAATRQNACDDDDIHVVVVTPHDHKRAASGLITWVPGERVINFG